MLADLVTAIDAALAGRAGSLSLPPHVGWLVVCLLRQRRRQRWHHEVVERHLHGVRGHGKVPGLRGWQYRSHGHGYALRAPDGEVIDADLLDPDGRVIDAWFFAERVRTARTRHRPEGRLWRWLPSTGLIDLAVKDALADGVVAAWNDGHRFVLTDELEARVPAVTAVDFGDPRIADSWQQILGDGDERVARVEHERQLARWATRGDVAGRVVADARTDE